jgi:ribonuclease-3
MRSPRELEDRIGVTFRDRALLAEALTHSSFANEQSGDRPADNERLEFLGDAVLGFVVGDALFRENPGSDEGQLSRIRAFLVSSANLVGYAEKFELGDYLRLGRGEERSGGRDKPALLVNAFESLVGALYLDRGLDATREFVVQLFGKQLSDSVVTYLDSVDSKSMLQETLQAMDGRSPQYRLVEESGPDHQKRFRVEVHLGGNVVAEGTGTTKKAAEQAAARRALEGQDAEPGGPATGR